MRDAGGDLVSTEITIVTTNGVITVENMPQHRAEALLRDFDTGESRTLRVFRDDVAVTHLARRYIVRIDVDS